MEEAARALAPDPPNLKAAPQLEQVRSLPPLDLDALDHLMKPRRDSSNE